MYFKLTNKPYLLTSLPPHIKDSTNIQKFKANIKQWNAENCECNLCRT